MGKWFLDFSFWIQSYRTAQTAHCAVHNVHCIHMSVCYWEPRLKLRKKNGIVVNYWCVGWLKRGLEPDPPPASHLPIRSPTGRTVVCGVLQYAAKHIDQ